jgi:enoyl-CoA hydratase/carnithine racemase
MNNGFLGISNRSNAKPIIAALNGPSYGGGTETLVNCDLVVALRSATISLPEVRRGVAAVAGALPRLGRNVTLQRANQLALVGEPISATTAEQWGLINALADSVEELDAMALKFAAAIIEGCPESIFVSQRGVRKGYEQTALSLKEATDELAANEMVQLQKSDNYIEGLTAFTEKRKPKWTSKL